MDVVEFTPSFEQYAFTFGGNEPIRRITPGTALRLWSDDAFCGALRSVSDLSSEEVELTLTEEQVVVDKEVVPVERIRLDKEVVSGEQTVEETVRKERVDVEGAGQLEAEPRR